MLQGALRINLAKPAETRTPELDARVAAGLESTPVPQPLPDSYLAQLAKLFPTEIVAAYTLGVAALDAAGYPTWWFAMVCAAAVVLLRSIATQSDDGRSAQPVAVAIALVSFLLWVLVQGGWFLPPIVPKPDAARIIGSVLAPLWLAVAPIIVTKSEKSPAG